MAQTKAQLLGPVVGDVTIDASTLSLDAENNKVGIGTTEADLRLHVNGPNALPSSSGSTSTGHLTLRDKAGSASHGMFMGVSNVSPWSSWIQAQDANNNATNYPLLLNPNGGNIGIGYTSPVAKLEVNGHIRLQGNGRIGVAGSGDTPETSIRFTDSDNISFIVGNGVKAQITNGGDINIGTVGRFDASGLVKSSHGSESSPSHSFLNDPDNGMYRPTTNTLGLVTGGSERLRITSGGDVSIGGLSSPRAKLDIDDAGTGKDVILRVSADDNNPYALVVANDTFNTTSNRGLAFWIGSNKVHHISARTSETASENELSIDAGDDIYFKTNANERLRITSAGLVGIGHQQEGQITKELTIRPANDGGIRFVRPGSTGASVMSHLELTTTTSGSVFPGGEAYTVKYNSINNDQIFTTYLSGGTGGNISFQTGSGSGNEVERLRITSDGKFHTGNPSGLSTDDFNITSTGTGGTLSLNRAQSGNASDSDLLGAVSFQSYPSGSGFASAESAIRSYAETGQSGSAAPSDLRFYTKPSTVGPGGSASERLIINSSGILGINKPPETDWASSYRAIEIGNSSLSGYQGGTYPSIELNMNCRGTQSSYSAGWKRILGMRSTQIHMPYNGTIHFRRAVSDSVDSSITWLETMRLTNEGTVNINTGADGGGGGFAQPQLYLKTNSTSWTSGAHFEESGGDSLGVINHSSDGFEIAQSYRTAAGSYKPIIFRTSGTERLRITSGGELVINGNPQAKARLDVGQAGNSLPAFNITFPDNSFYRNLGTVGPNDTVGNSSSTGGQYLHIRLRTIWNDNSMTMFRITGYYSYSAYTESYVGMYRYSYNPNRYAPYGQIISNQSRATVHSMYNTNADPGYLVIVCDWATNYMGLMIEHYGAGGSYGSNMQHDLQIIDTKRSTGTSAQW